MPDQHTERSSRAPQSATLRQRELARMAWLIALTCFTARLIIHPLDGLSWHVFGENFYLPGLYKHLLNAVLLLSISAAIVLSAAAWFDERRLHRGAVNQQQRPSDDDFVKKPG